MSTETERGNFGHLLVLQKSGPHRLVIRICGGKPDVQYTGFNCGCCGRWVNHAFSVPARQSMGAWWDTIGLCDKCCADSDNEPLQPPR